MKQRTLTLASAGHTPIIHKPKVGTAQLLSRTGPALDVSDNVTFAEHIIRFAAGDRLLVYTDGAFGFDQAAGPFRVSRWIAMPHAEGREFVSAVAREITELRARGHDDEIDDVTVLLLEAVAGDSVFDNGDDAGAELARAPRTARSPIIYYGESEAAWFLALRERATWLHSDVFYEAAHAIIQEHHALFIDLSQCGYLDSTMLGTVHELVSTGQVQVCGVSPAVRALFDELKMDTVIANISDVTPPVDLLPLAADRLPAASKARMLSAHEALAGLNDDNRSRFKDVVEELRGAGEQGKQGKQGVQGVQGVQGKQR